MFLGHFFFWSGLFTLFSDELKPQTEIDTALAPSHLSIYFSPLCVCQSVDPGQQFTWEHSNLEVNKPKNRYANVIAYDHSRVILTPVDGERHIFGHFKRGGLTYCNGRGLYLKHTYMKDKP